MGFRFLIVSVGVCGCFWGGCFITVYYKQQLEAKSEYENPEKFIESWSLLRSAHGVLVPGGFGDRGVEGKIAAAKYAREADVPYLGICLGMQVKHPLTTAKSFTHKGVNSMPKALPKTGESD